MQKYSYMLIVDSIVYHMHDDHDSDDLILLFVVQGIIQPGDLLWLTSKYTVNMQ